MLICESATCVYEDSLSTELYMLIKLCFSFFVTDRYIVDMVILVYSFLSAAINIDFIFIFIHIHLVALIESMYFYFWFVQK